MATPPLPSVLGHPRKTVVRIWSRVGRVLLPAGPEEVQLLADALGCHGNAFAPGLLRSPLSGVASSRLRRLLFPELGAPPPTREQSILRQFPEAGWPSLLLNSQGRIWDRGRSVLYRNSAVSGSTASSVPLERSGPIPESLGVSELSRAQPSPAEPSRTQPSPASGSLI